MLRKIHQPENLHPDPSMLSKFRVPNIKPSLVSSGARVKEGWRLCPLVAPNLDRATVGVVKPDYPNPCWRVPGGAWAGGCVNQKPVHFFWKRWVLSIRQDGRQDVILQHHQESQHYGSIPLAISTEPLPVTVIDSHKEQPSKFTVPKHTETLNSTRWAQKTSYL